MSDLTSPEQPVVRRRARMFALTLGLLLTVLIGWQGYQFGKLHLMLSRAHRDLAINDVLRAEFWIGIALKLSPENVEALRLMADIQQALDKPAALDWRREVARHEPTNPENFVTWAKSAVRFGRREMAVKVLENLPATFKDRSADYHEILAGCALEANEVNVAEGHFLRAAEIDPSNPFHRANLAALRLTNTAGWQVWGAAAGELEAALADPRVNLLAARALLRDALKQNNRPRAQRLAAKLRSLPGCDFGDSLLCLECLSGEPSFGPTLEALEQRAVADPRQIAQVSDWLISRGMAGESLRWTGTLPQLLQMDPQVQMTVADAYLSVGNWPGLAAFLEKCHWPASEWLKRAMLIRCKRELSKPWEKEWKQFAGEVGTVPAHSLLLARLVLGWNWREEALGLLWAAAARPATEAKALQQLWALYAQSGETGELLRVAKAQLERDPDGPAHKNNYAFLRLLLYGASTRAEALALEAITANPEIPEWTATYAYALHLAGKDPAAKASMEKLSADKLGRPGVALYYAIVLEACGNAQQAKASLAKFNSNGLLPEEKKLAEDLKLRLAGSNR